MRESPSCTERTLYKLQSSHPESGMRRKRSAATTTPKKAAANSPAKKAAPTAAIEDDRRQSSGSEACPQSSGEEVRVTEQLFTFDVYNEDTMRAVEASELSYEEATYDEIDVRAATATEALKLARAETDEDYVPVPHCFP